MGELADDSGTEVPVLVYTCVDGVEWGIEAARVRAILDEEEWRGVLWPEPRPLGPGPLPGGLLCAPPARSRILMVETAAGSVPLLVAGPLSVRSVARGAILQLPACVLGAAQAQPLCGVVFMDGQTPLLLIDAVRLSAPAGPEEAP